MNRDDVTRNGPQIWDAGGDLSLGHADVQAEGNSPFESRVRIMMPDSRLRVKVSLGFVRDNPNSTEAVSEFTATVYIGEEEHYRKTGKRILSGDVLRTPAGVIVTQSAPLSIPEDADLEGWSQEFVTAADSLLLIFNATARNAPVTPAGHWLLKTRFQPEGQRLCPEDWDQVVRKCHPFLLGSEFLV